MFSNFLLRSFRILLLPFALVYWLGLCVRNFLYDRDILKSATFGIPLICVGNLSVGGTGKSPMVEYIIRLLSSQYHVATLSRGYKRKTRGYALANDHSTALDIGDEPMQFHRKFPDVPVAVGEERIVAIGQLLHDRPATDAIILDDAFQHRAIAPGLNILLTDYHNLFTRDFYLPTGDLRDLKKSARRAQVIVVTKCDGELNREAAGKIRDEVKRQAAQPVFFTTIAYDPLYHISGKGTISIGKNTEVLLVSGIANPRPMKKWLEERCNGYQMLQYPDHHIFTVDELQEIRKRLDQMTGLDKIILTTEKDAVRLQKFGEAIADLPFYVLPVRHEFLFDEGPKFDQIIQQFVVEFPARTKS